jgi:hypothetical protein
MRFTPGKSVVLEYANGAEVVATPLFYTPYSGAGIQVELYTSDGIRLKCLDEAKGEYAIGEREQRLRIKPADKIAAQGIVPGSLMTGETA